MHDSRIAAVGGILHRMAWHVTHDEGISWCGTTFRPVLVPVPSFGFPHPCSPHLVTVSGKSRVLPARRSVPNLECHIMSRSHTLIAGPLFLAAALTSHASAGVVINMFDDGADMRVTVTGSFDFFVSTQSSSNNQDVYKVTSTQIDFRKAYYGSLHAMNVTEQFTGDFGGSTTYGSVESYSLPFMIARFSDGVWRVYADSSVITGQNSFDWDVRFSYTSIAARGFNVGTYVWTWTDGTDTDTLTLNIGASTPAVPGVGALAALGGVGLAGRRRRR
jgi:hypothetical protein